MPCCRKTRPSSTTFMEREIKCSASRKLQSEDKIQRHGRHCPRYLPGITKDMRKCDFTKTRVKIYAKQKTTVAAFLTSSPRFYMKRSSSLYANRCNYPKTASYPRNQGNFRQKENHECSNMYTVELTAKDENMESTKSGEINRYLSSSSEQKRNKESRTVTRNCRVSASFKNKALRHIQERIANVQLPSMKTSSSDKFSPVEVQNGVPSRGTRSNLPSSKKNMRRKALWNTSTNKESQISRLSSSSIPSSKSSSVSAQDEYDDAISESDGMDIKVEHKGKYRMDTTVDSERSQPRKLRFRRGKVIEPHAENYALRKQKFRRAKVHVKNISVKGDARWRGLRKVIGDGLSRNNTDSFKTALRKQLAGSNKVPESLSNDIIEETASKLVKARKSKVKALVGAFETVISLQDKKTEVSITDPK